MAGYYSGFLDASSKLRTLSRQDDELELAREGESRLKSLADSDIASEELARRRGEEELKAYQIEQAEKERQREVEKKTRILMSRAAKNAEKEVVGDGVEESLKRQALTIYDTARKLEGLDYNKSRELFSQAREIENDYHKSKYIQIERKFAKNELLGQAFSSVTDQMSLDQAVKDAALLGEVVPPQYQTWNMATKGYLTRKSLMSKAMQTKLETEKTMAEVAYKNAQARYEDAKAETEQGKAKRDEALERAKVFKDPTITKSTLKADAQMVSVLDSRNELFKDLDEDAKAVVVRDIKSKALQLQRTSPNLDLDPLEAINMATEQVLGNIEEGKGWGSSKYNPKKPKFVEGKVYVDENGNKAMYKNGEWIPQ